jgi:hypothetical protein
MGKKSLKENKKIKQNERTKQTVVVQDSVCNDRSRGAKPHRKLS